MHLILKLHDDDLLTTAQQRPSLATTAASSFRCSTLNLMPSSPRKSER
jgi:hypothetical protein